MKLAAWLQMIARAMVNPAAIYPIDYEGIRKEAIALLGQALGKELVPRDMYDDIVERQDDLMMDKLGKIEREKTELIAIRDEAERASLDRALSAALSAETKGFIVHHRCHTCKRLIAAVPTRTEISIPKCPLCGATNPLPTQTLSNTAH
jgi:hypothetical protein